MPNKNLDMKKEEVFKTYYQEMRRKKANKQDIDEFEENKDALDSEEEELRILFTQLQSNNFETKKEDPGVKGQLDTSCKQDTKIPKHLR